MMDMNFIIIVPAEGIAGIDIKDGLHVWDRWKKMLQTEGLLHLFSLQEIQQLNNMLEAYISHE